MGLFGAVSDLLSPIAVAPAAKDSASHAIAGQTTTASSAHASVVAKVEGKVDVRQIFGFAVSGLCLV